MKAAGATWYALYREGEEASSARALFLSGAFDCAFVSWRWVCVSRVCVLCVGCCAPCASVCVSLGLCNAVWSARWPTKIKLKIAFKNERNEWKQLVFFFSKKWKVRKIKGNSKLQFGGAVDGADLFLDSTHESREHKRRTSRGRKKWKNKNKTLCSWWFLLVEIALELNQPHKYYKFNYKE